MASHFRRSGSHSCISDAIARRQDRKEMQILALLQNITYQQHKGTNGIFCISLEGLNSEVCSKDIVVGLKLTETACAIERAFPMTQQCSTATFECAEMTWLKLKWKSCWFPICRRPVVSDDIKSDGVRHPLKTNSSNLFIGPFIRIVATLQIAFSWLPFSIGQVRSQVWCRPYLVAHFGFFDLRTFSWSLSKVQVSSFYPFTLKLGSKCT